ncbi:MAG TPA: radical SAM protein [Candidatus Acidoferrum sp.]|nr:radical SAM protein [Candidatus Acidoferrum sp.]
MLRFPLRLTADLTRARLAQWSRANLQPVQFVDAAELLHHDSNHPVSHEKIRELVSGRSPVVWIGGSEPLAHPGTAHLVRAITGSGHFVFLETDGTMLRRRTHEFQPVPRLFLTVRLDPHTKLDASQSLRPSLSELAVEGIRAAQLSGFMICVHACVQPETELSRVSELIGQARSIDVDGIVVTAASSILARTAAEARKLIGSKWWESFSRLVEPLVSGQRHAPQSVEENRVNLEQQESANEEGVKVA